MESMTMRRGHFQTRFLASAVIFAAPLTAAARPAQNTSAVLADPIGSDAIGEIVVTAQKRSQSVQKIPVTVAALTGAALTQSGVKDLFQAVTLVPGVTFSRAPDDGLALNFRGLGTTARPQAFEQSVALFTDGVFMGKSRLYSQTIFDLDRIEFIKGTQSTLLGKNASVGAISIVDRQPGDHIAANGSAGYEASNGGYQLDAGVDLPVGEGSALRIAGHYNDLNGWVHNDITGQEGPEHKDFGLRLTGRFKASDILTITASYQLNDNKQIGSSTQLTGPVPAGSGLEGVLDYHSQQFTTLTSNGDTFHHITSHIASVKGELKLGDSTLVSQTAFVHYNLHFLDDLDFDPDQSANFKRDEKYDQLTQEFRLQSAAGLKLEYMFGLYFLYSHWNSQELQAWATPSFPPPPSPISGQLFNGPFTNSFVQRQYSYSGFAAGTYHFTETLRLNGGFRYTREEKRAVYGRTNQAPFTIWNTISNPPFDPTPLAHNASFFDGNASLQYDVTPQIMAYASYGHGSKSGGYVETASIFVPPPLLVNGKVPATLVAASSAIKDEFTDSYEIGLKSRLFDRRLLINIDVFDMELQNFQDTVFTGGPLGFITSNSPARSRGVEFQAGLQVTPKFRVSGGLTYADTTSVFQPIDYATAALVTDANGNPIYKRYKNPIAPNIIYNIDLSYETELGHDLKGRLGVDVRHRDSVFGQRQELFPADQLTTLDLSAGIGKSNDRYGLSISARNVTNAIAADFSGPSVDPRYVSFGSPNQSRTVLLTFGFSY